MTNPSIPPLGHLSDDALASLAAGWRTRAGRGEREAFGIAHALEVELRRRTRDSYLQSLPPEAPSPPRPWWRFWARTRPGGGDGPMSAT